MSKFGKKQEPQDPTKVPVGIDTTTFFTPQIPDEVKATITLIRDLPPEVVRGCLEKVLECYVTGNISDEDFIAFQKEHKQSGINFGVIFSGLCSIFQTAIATKSNVSTINGDLKRMNLPPLISDAICRAILTSRSAMESRALAVRSGFSKLQKLRWRIDVTISSGSLSRVMRPSILMQLILSDGSIKTFEVSVEQFNQLRYGVAKVLHDMQSLERHPIMKIVKEFDRRDEEDRNKEEKEKPSTSTSVGGGAAFGRK